MMNLPSSWVLSPIGEIAEINPTLDKSVIADDLRVSFVPMPGVEAESGRIDVSASRPFAEVKKGYTPFQEGDVLFAKITPCMENGKMAIVPKVQGKLGFGSTEFHVLRPPEGISAEYLYHFVSSKRFRIDAEHNMTGAVGQRRVPAPYLAKESLPIPPSAEQRRIVAKIEELFSELDKGIETLKTAKAQLAIYRQAILKDAFEGKLTAEWRSKHSDQMETAEQLIARIRRDGPTTKTQWLEIDPPINELPYGWTWISFGNICQKVRNGISAKPIGESGDKILRISAVRPMKVDLDDYRFIQGKDGEYDQYYLQAGDLLFTRYNGSRKFVGVCGCYRSSKRRLYPDKLIQCRIGTASVIPDFIEAAFAAGETRRFIESKIRTTAGQAGVSGGDIKAAPVPLCSKQEQEVIVAIIGAKISSIDALESDIETNLLKAEALRQSILKKAFAGELVSQDPSDEPASILLDRIRAERAEKTPRASSIKPKTRGRKPRPVTT